MQTQNPFMKFSYLYPFSRLQTFTWPLHRKSWDGWIVLHLINKSKHQDILGKYFHNLWYLNFMMKPSDDGTENSELHEKRILRRIYLIKNFLLWKKFLTIPKPLSTHPIMNITKKKGNTNNYRPVSRIKSYESRVSPNILILKFHSGWTYKMG